jgi:hypothetical protein
MSFGDIGQEGRVEDFLCSDSVNGKSHASKGESVFRREKYHQEP